MQISGMFHSLIEILQIISVIALYYLVYINHYASECRKTISQYKAKNLHKLEAEVKQSEQAEKTIGSAYSAEHFYHAGYRDAIKKIMLTEAY